MRKLFIVLFLVLVFGCGGSDGDSSTDKDTPEIKDKKVPAEEVVIPAGTTGIAVNGVDAIKKIVKVDPTTATITWEEDLDAEYYILYLRADKIVGDRFASRSHLNRDVNVGNVLTYAFIGLQPNAVYSVSVRSVSSTARHRLFYTNIADNSKQQGERINV